MIKDIHGKHGGGLLPEVNNSRGWAKSGEIRTAGLLQKVKRWQVMVPWGLQVRPDT